MPQIGGVYVPDNLMPTLDVPERPRPGLGEIFGASADQAIGQLRYGLPLQAKTLTGTATQEDVDFYDEGLRRTAEAGSAAAPAGLTDLFSGKVNLGRFAVENLAASVPYMAGGIIGAVGGGLVGGPGGALAGAIAGGVPQFSASNVARAVEEEGGLSQAAAERSLAVAPLQSAADFAVARFLPGAGKLLGDVAAAQTGGFLSRTAKAVMKAGATEALTEAGQQVGERFAANQNLTSADAAKEYVTAAVTAFTVGGLLGAGGGFRSNATMKPAAEVTNEDINERVDAMLALPAPTAFTDAAGRTVVGSDGIDQLNAAPRVGEEPYDLGEGIDIDRDPRVQDMFSQVASEPPKLPLGSQPSVAALMGEPVGAANEVQVETRPFAQEPFEDLESVLAEAAKGKKLDDNLLAEVQREVEFRKQETLGNAPLSTENFQSRVDEMKRGLRGGFVQNLEATSPEELTERVYDQIFTEQDDRANTRKFAQRVGILDENLEPGPEALKVEARRAMNAAADEMYAVMQEQDAAAAPRAEAPATIDPEFEPKWNELKSARPDPTIKALNPTNEADLRGKVLQALAETGGDEKNNQRPTPQMQKLARDLGIVTNDDAMDITELGRQTYLKSSEGLEDAVEAAQAQGFTGARASIFERGVRAITAGEQAPKFDSFEDMAAYQAGKVWSERFVKNPQTKTAAQTKKFLADRVANKPGRLRNQYAVSYDLTPTQVQQQALNQMLETADLRGVADTDVAALYRAVRDGTSAADVGKMLEQVQGGKTLFIQPESAPFEPTPARNVRGQPLFREMNTPDPKTSTKAQDRKQTQKAVEARKNALRAEIDGAFESGDINGIERLQLVVRLVNGDYTGVANRLPGGPLRNEMNVSRRGFLSGVAAAAAVAGIDAANAKASVLKRTPAKGQFRQFLESGNIYAALGHIKDNSADRSFRMIADKLLAGGGWEQVTMYTEADRGPLHGSAGLNPDGSTTVILYGENGLTEETFLHEMVHAYVQQRWAGVSVYTPNNKRLLNAEQDRRDEVITSFRDMWQTLGRALKKNNPALLESEAWAQNFYSDPDEALAWLMTDKRVQTYMRSVDPKGNKIAKASESLWVQFKEWVAGLLNIKLDKPVTALDNLLDAGYSILDAGKDVRTGEFNVLMAEALENQMLTNEMRTSTENRTVTAAEDVTSQTAQMVAAAAEKMNAADLWSRFRRVGFGWLSINHLVRQFGNTLPALKEYQDAHGERVAVLSRLQQIGTQAQQRFEALEQTKPERAAQLGQLMALSTEFQIDPTKPWENHDHLQNDKNAEKLKALHKRSQDMYNTLRRNEGGEGAAIYDELRALNEASNYARMASGLHNLVAMDPELSLGLPNSQINPMDVFMREQNLDTATATRDYWSKALNAQISAAEAYVRERKGESSTATPSAQKAWIEHLSPIEMQVRAIYEAKAAMDKSPYFHLGRFGDHFVSFVVAKNKDGTVDNASLQKVALELEKAGYEDVQISTDSTKPRVMIRLDTVDARRALQGLAMRMQKNGLLDPEEIKAGPRSKQGNYGVADGMPEYVARYLQAIEASPMYVPDEGMDAKERSALAQRKAEAIQMAIDTWLEQQPDSSISKVLVKRYNVPGYNKDMMRNWAHRWRVGAISLANVAAAPKFNKALGDMRGQYLESLGSDNDLDPDLINDLITEVRARDATTPVNDIADTFDKIRAVSHSYFLGLSPAYALINMTQLGVVAIPELAKKHGYAKSFHAMRRASTDAWAILKAAAAEAKSLGPKHWADVTITESVLKKAGLSADVRSFTMQMMASGTIDIGSAGRALGQVAEGRAGSKLDVALRYASAMGLYTETFSRLTAALTARELKGGSGPEVEAYAKQVVTDAMFDYQAGNTARQMGKAGFLGPVTPLLTQFMQYSVQMVEKLYSETTTAFAGDTPEKRREARVFMAGHLTAVTALAGSLGLPFATVFATVLERLVDAFDDDDEPYDATAAWRNFLASVLGKDMGEVVARGLPRAFGLDLSQRAGEQNLLPFSEFLADRRGWKEAVSNSAGRSIGAAPNMVVNVLEGGNMIAEGKLLEGMKTMLPVGLKAPVEVYRMTTDGYVDTKGNKMPMTPGASAMMWQLLGFSPAEKAEYSEARGDQMARRGEIGRKATNLRQQIVRAMLTGDEAKAKELVADAVKFDEDNPGFAVIPSLQGSLTRQSQARAQAVALQSPVGVSIKDIAGQGLTGYANVNYSQ